MEQTRQKSFARIQHSSYNFLKALSTQKAKAHDMVALFDLVFGHESK